MPEFTIKNLSGETIWKGDAYSLPDALGHLLIETEGWHLPRDMDLRDQDLSGIPVVPDIDRAILEAVSQPGACLDMSCWHQCGTTHCRAGWAIHLAGDAGYTLERQAQHAGYTLERQAQHAEIAGALIYAASRPGVPIPDFFCEDEEAMDDLRRCAGVEA